MPSTDVARAAAALPQNPSREDIHTAAEAVAVAAIESAAAVPGRAVTQYVRHHFGDRTRELQDEIRGCALAVVKRETEAMPAVRLAQTRAPTGSAYYPLILAALRMGISEKQLRQMLKFPQCRRALGWPRCWNGIDWFILISAIENPASVVGLAPIEPPHNLPAWCLRVADVADMETFPMLGCVA